MKKKIVWSIKGIRCLPFLFDRLTRIYICLIDRTKCFIFVYSLREKFSNTVFERFCSIKCLPLFCLIDRTKCCFLVQFEREIFLNIVWTVLFDRSNKIFILNFSFTSFGNEKNFVRSIEQRQRLFAIFVKTFSFILQVLKIKRNFVWSIYKEIRFLPFCLIDIYAKFSSLKRVCRIYDSKMRQCPCM
jgi:hypothetical protein